MNVELGPSLNRGPARLNCIWLESTDVLLQLPEEVQGITLEDMPIRTKSRTLMVAGAWISMPPSLIARREHRLYVPEGRITLPPRPTLMVSYVPGVSVKVSCGAPVRLEPPHVIGKAGG